MDRMVTVRSFMPENAPNLFIFEQQRRESFLEWPFKSSDKCSIEKMAEAGFYWCGVDEEPDSAACFMCDKHLDNWESTDDPWNEHKRHAPQCAFIALGRPEADLTVDEFLTVLHTALLNKFERKKIATSQKIDKITKHARDRITRYHNQKG